MARVTPSGKYGEQGTALRRMVACLIKESGTGTKYSGKNANVDGQTCSFVKQAKVILGMLPYGACCRGGKCDGRDSRKDKRCAGLRTELKIAAVASAGGRRAATGVGGRK